MQRFELLLEAEQFSDYGGWVLDSQFENEMGSPYLLAHGIGTPCADASTKIIIPEDGEYRVWVRAKDWVPAYHPGTFQVLFNDTPVPTTFGANGKDWSWELVEHVHLPAGTVQVKLHDLTGFDGRCDAIYITNTTITPPEKPDSAARAWRKRLLHLPQEPVNAGSYDVVVVGGGIPACCAAYTAAKLGLQVAIIQNRPCLGGNGSKELGLIPEGVAGPIVDAITERQEDGDIGATAILNHMPNVSVFLEEEVYNVVLDGRKIVAVDSRNARTSVEHRYFAPTFIDGSGRALLALLSGAATMGGEEAKSDFGESLAPEKASAMHHGNTIFFRTEEMDQPVSFPDVPWAVEVAKDHMDLSGQIGQVSSCCGHGPYENKPGPYIGPEKQKPRRREDGSWENPMSLPKTHFWEYGQWLDQYSDGEAIRDHLLQAIIGTYDNVRRKDPKKYANLKLTHLTYQVATGAFRSYLGDYVLSEKDIREHKFFPDAVVMNESAFCLHYPGNPKYDFRLGNWKWDERDGKPYSVPFRCLYSADIDNLFCCGKHISATHIASSNLKLMGNGGQHGIAVGAAAALCKKYKTMARGILNNHLEELKEVIKKVNQ
ncbi:MAG: FAD-dependent oxidoreductase [Acidaminococcus sp.]|jgi:hypothetical protein|nr:FAD-dependent oxidoreductase [Acidaminococcus sp.]MCI2100015.1 FAD-dependent oxidoreductase [Acidaminococcus sp.]MCI2114305.1 FAD-dependent oxidoreductase [Acidaminococcus sp.]MCI2116914.1 FAD-dependent oxidoreductase [Acidaminococcus sp.]